MGIINPSLSSARMAQLCGQLATLTKAGITPLRIFELLVNDSPRRDIRALAGRVRPRIEAGQPMAAAFRAEGKLFPMLFTGMVDLGERTGNLPHTFADLAEHYEHTAETYRLLIRQITYPLCILFAMWVAIPIAVIIISHAATGGTEGLVLVVLSLLLRQAVIPLLVVAFFAAAIMRVPLFRRWWITLVLAVWPFSRIYRRLSLARFARAMSLLQQTDIPPHHQLRAAASTLGHPRLAKPFAKAAARVKAGEDLGQAMRDVLLLDLHAHEYIAHGETAGRLQEVFESIASDQTEAARHAITCLLYPLEGALIVLLGIYIVLCNAVGG